MWLLFLMQQTKIASKHMLHTYTIFYFIMVHFFFHTIQSLSHYNCSCSFLVMFCIIVLSLFLVLYTKCFVYRYLFGTCLIIKRYLTQFLFFLLEHEMFIWFHLLICSIYMKCLFGYEMFTWLRTMVLRYNFLVYFLLNTNL